MKTGTAPPRTNRASRMACLATAWLFVLSFGGCTTSLDKAKQSAAMSQKLYVAVQGQVTSQIVDITKKDDASFSADDRSRLKVLNELRKTLDDYAAAHNAFVSALQVWETSAQKPATVDELSAKMLSLVTRVQALAKQIGLKLR